MGFGAVFAKVAPAAIASIGNIIGGTTSAKKAKRAAAQQRAWEEEMSNTSHQREVADLNAAGLNEILSANDGASTPPAAEANTPQFGDYGLLEGINTALTYETNKENAQANTTTSTANALNAQSSLRLNKALEEKANAETLKTQEETGLITPKAKAEIKNLNSATQLNKAIQEKNLVETTTTKGKGDYIFGREVENALKDLNKQKINSAKRSKLIKKEIEKEIFWAKDKAKRSTNFGATARW